MDWSFLLRQILLLNCVQRLSLPRTCVFLRALDLVYNQVIMKQVEYFSLSWLDIQYCCAATKRLVVIKCSLAQPIKSGVSGCQVSCFLAAARHWQTWCQIFRWLTRGWPHLSVWSLVMGVWTSCHLHLVLLALMYYCIDMPYIFFYMTLDRSYSFIRHSSICD